MNMVIICIAFGNKMHSQLFVISMESCRILEHRKVDGGVMFVDDPHHCHSNPPAHCIQALCVLCESLWMSC